VHYKLGCLSFVEQVNKKQSEMIVFLYYLLNFSYIIVVIILKIINYNRNSVLNYAEKWALSRNPAYYNFDLIGGDCTNFVSQCIFAGSKIMNFSSSNGWFYNNLNSRSPSWTSVDFLYKFLINNNSVGPFGVLVSLENLDLGDIVQLSFDGITFSHSLIVVKISDFQLNSIFIASHSIDSFNKPLSNYVYNDIRFIHINGVRSWS